MKELLEGRRFGFALRPLFGGAALGLGVAVTLLDLMAWFGWGTRATNGFLVASIWVSFAAAAIGVLSLLASGAELTDAPYEDRAVARLDLIGVGVATILYVVTAGLRSLDIGAAAPAPPAFLLALAALMVLGAGAFMSSLLYAAREWEETPDVAHVPQRRRRRAS